MELRPTTRADLAAMDGVFRAAIGDLYRRHRFTPPDPPAEVFAAQHAHLLEHDAERCWVAEEDGEVVGFTAAFVRGDTWFLSSLFVHPDHQAQGLGRRLLDRAWSDGVARRLTVTDAPAGLEHPLRAAGPDPGDASALVIRRASRRRGNRSRGSARRP